MSDGGGDLFRVLIVEDQARYRELLIREVAALGFLTAGASSADKAWELLLEQPVQVVMLDLHLPGRGGMELFGQIRSDCPDTEVVVLTAYGGLETSVQALRWRAADYLTKPCSLDEIERVLCRLHQQWQERRRARTGVETEAGTPPPEESAAPAGSAERTLADLEREHILATLAACSGHKPSAAEQLGISLRTLYNKLKTYERD